MLISPEAYFNMEIKGKNPAEVMNIITELETEIEDLKAEINKEGQVIRMLPSPESIMDNTREILEIAKIEYDNRIDELVNVLKDLPEGTETTTIRLVSDLYGSESIDGRDETWMTVDRNLREAAERAGLHLDMSEHEYKLEGLSYNLSFRIVK